ncbi:MAG: hypothetical protein HRF40_11250 [Nitrososphaera sp.]|jgi:hypothetical protein
MVPESYYIPDREIRDVRDLARRSPYFVTIRTMFKYKMHAELSKKWMELSKKWMELSKKWMIIVLTCFQKKEGSTCVR